MKRNMEICKTCYDGQHFEKGHILYAISFQKIPRDAFLYMRSVL